MNYTKGEWKARYAGVNLSWYIDAEEREVAKVLVYPPYPDNEARASANLIAAAPEMYEALKAIYAQLESGYIANDCHNADLMRRKLELQAKKALAKAEGRNNMAEIISGRRTTRQGRRTPSNTRQS